MSAIEDRFDLALNAHGGTRGQRATIKLAAAPLLAALRHAGSRHLYADTADVDELCDTLEIEPGAFLAEIDGNTMNQPLVHKVLERHLEGDEPARWAREIRGDRAELPPEDLAPLLYTVACSRIAGALVQQVAGGRPWELSLQLHMGLAERRDAAIAVSRSLHRAFPTGLVKVPFLPYEPASLLLARDLEREGIRVNVTSTFSARQAVVAALLTGASRTNVFLGRLDQGLGSERIGEATVRSAQKAVRTSRETDGVETELIAASVRRWETLVGLAGVDVLTVPCSVIDDFLNKADLAPEDVRARIDDEPGDVPVSSAALEVFGEAGIRRLTTVEPELVELLRALRKEPVDDGEALVRRFESEGFGDLFHAPNEEEWRDLRRGKLPDLESPLSRKLAIDTLYTLLADADFRNHQDEMDETLLARAGA